MILPSPGAVGSCLAIRTIACIASIASMHPLGLDSYTGARAEHVASVSLRIRLYSGVFLHSLGEGTKEMPIGQTLPRCIRVVTAATRRPGVVSVKRVQLHVRSVPTLTAVPTTSPALLGDV